MKTTNWEDHSDQLGRLNAWIDIDPKRTAVVTIDMHRGHLGGEDATMPVREEVTARVLGAAEKFLRFARDTGMPVIHAILTWRPEEAYRFNPRVDAGRMTLSHEAPATRALAEGTLHNLVGSIQCELMPEIGPEPGDRIIDSKKTQSIYLGTELDVLLGTFLDVETLILMGINTNTCVQCAAFESLNRGYQVVVLEDCVGSMYGDDLHEAALQNIARCLGWVMSTDQVMAKLQSEN
ncbi:MAG: cysteine hydrolase [Acidimicrobiia bacterium]